MNKKMKKKIIFIVTVLLFLIILFFSLKMIRDNEVEKSRDGVEVTLESGDYKFTISQGDTERYYLLHIPKSYDGKAAPLIFALHGGMGTAEIMSENYGWKEKSEKEGFIIVFPNGASRLKSGKIATWNAGNCCGYASEKNSDDVSFVKAVIKDIKAKVNIGKIFATGMSNGGMMSHRLACEMSEEFSAIAAVAGTNNYDFCNPKKPISILHVHGLADSHVLFNGGSGPDSLTKVDYKSVPNTISEWKSMNNCDDRSKRVFEDEDGYCDLYSQCDDGAQVKLCVAKNGGHSWPGVSKSQNSFEGSTATRTFSATDEIWNFFVTK